MGVSTCPFCSMGCTWRPGRDDAHAIPGEPPAPVLDYDAGGPNRGSLCAKGNMALELLTHPRRLDSPLVREGGAVRPVPWDEALARAAAAVRGVVEEHGGPSVAVLLGPRTTDEEARAAVRLARAIGTPHVDLCEPSDQAALSGIARSGARPARFGAPAEIEAANALLVVGDLFTLAPCAARSVLTARYANRRHTVAVLGPAKSRTTWFGRPFVRCAPNEESAALALVLLAALDAAGDAAPPWARAAKDALADVPAADLERRSGVTRGAATQVAAALRAGAASGVLLAAEFGTTARPDLVAGLAALVAEATGARFLPMLEGANSEGVRAVLDAEGFPGDSGDTAPEILEAAVTGDVRALLVIGADPVAAFPGTVASQALRAAELCLVTAPFPGPSAGLASIVLPAAVIGEKAGTVRSAFGASELVPAMPPPGLARPDLAVLGALADALGAAPESARPARGPHAPPRGGAFLEDLTRALQPASPDTPRHDPGTHLLLAEGSAAHSGEGSLTSWLSWPAYAHAEPLLAVTPAHAAALGVRTGDRVRLRSASGRAELRVRVHPGLPEGVVTAPHRDPAVRALLRWRREPAARCLDLRPDRVSLERAEEVRT